MLRTSGCCCDCDSLLACMVGKTIEWEASGITDDNCSCSDLNDTRIGVDELFLTSPEVDGLCGAACVFPSADLGLCGALLLDFDLNLNMAIPANWDILIEGIGTGISIEIGYKNNEAAVRSAIRDLCAGLWVDMPLVAESGDACNFSGLSSRIRLVAA